MGGFGLGERGLMGSLAVEADGAASFGDGDGGLEGGVFLGVGAGGKRSEARDCDG
jgi:hypothetical protein